MSRLREWTLNAIEAAQLAAARLEAERQEAARQEVAARIEDARPGLTAQLEAEPC